MAALPPPLGPILAAPLLPLVEDALLGLLAGLSGDDWDRPTIVPGWRVRHVAGHLLDTSLRKLAAVRDGHAPDRPRSGSAADLRAFVDRLNAEGVAVYSRLSPSVLLALMRQASREFCEFHLALDPFAPAAFAVSWAGQTESPNWFDTARELTERWHHQEQIRLAVGRPGIMTPELYRPVLDCFMRALPHAYRDVAAGPESRVTIRVDGVGGGEWHLFRGRSAWMLVAQPAGHAVATVAIPGTIAWRLFTKGLTRAEADARVVIEGTRALGVPVLHAMAIVG